MAHAERMGKYRHAKTGWRKREKFPYLVDTGPNSNYLERIGPISAKYLEKYDADSLSMVAIEIESLGLKGSLDSISFKKIDLDAILLGAIIEFCNIRHHLSQDKSSKMYLTLDEISFKEFYQGLKINEHILRDNQRGLKNIRDILEATYQILKDKKSGDLPR